MYTFDQNQHDEYCTVDGYLSTTTISADCGRDIVCDFPSSDPSSNSNGGDASTNDIGVIVGCTIGGVLAVIAISGFVYYYFWYRKASNTDTHSVEVRDSKVINILAENNNNLK